MSVLAKAVRAIPSQKPGNRQLQFIDKMLSVYINYAENKTQRQRRQENEDLESYLKPALRIKIAAIIFYQSDTSGKQLLERILDLAVFYSILDDYQFSGFDVQTYLQSIIKQFIFITDNAIGKKNQELAIVHFKNLWIALDNYLSEKQVSTLGNFLLLDIEWYTGTVNWIPVSRMNPFFEMLIDKYGIYHPMAVLNLLTYPGNEQLMPAGISRFVSILKNGNSHKALFLFNHVEEFVQGTYNRYWDKLIEDKNILQDYLWILDTLVEQGSTTSYWIREYLISFRSKVEV